MASHICDQQRRQVSPQRWAVKLAERVRGEGRARRRGGKREEARADKEKMERACEEDEVDNKERGKRGEVADRRESDKQAGTGKNRGTCRHCCAVMGRLTTRP